MTRPLNPEALGDLYEALESGIALLSKGVDPRLDDVIDRARAALEKARSQ